MKRTFEFGKIAYNGSRRINKVTVDIELRQGKSGPVFSASCMIWNNLQTEIVAGGQCLDELIKHSFPHKKLFLKIFALWKRNHLNDMNAGTPEQTAAVDTWVAAGHPYSYYEACEFLKTIGLYTVLHEGEMYKYGERWLYRPISAEDLAAIKQLLA